MGALSRNGLGCLFYDKANTGTLLEFLRALRRKYGRMSLEWIVGRYKITTDKDGGITNDPCTSTDIISVIERAVYAGVESDRIIAGLPKEFEPNPDWQPKKMSLDRYAGGD